MALAENALTDYATVSAYPGMGSSVFSQPFLEGLINQASQALETFTARRLTFNGSQNDLQPMYGTPKLLLDRTPILTIASIAITDDNSTDGEGIINPSEYFVDDAFKGTVWRDNGWWSSALLQSEVAGNFNLDQSPGDEKSVCNPIYAGGFITGPQAYGAGAYPGSGQNVTAGTLINDGTGQLWLCTQAGLTAGVSFPTNPKSAQLVKQGLVNGTTSTDGAAIWTAMGTAGSAGARGTGCKLPADLERACILTVQAYAMNAGNNPNVKSESMLGVSYTYNPTTGLAPEAEQIAARYARFT